MKLDLGSFAFGSTITSGGNTPSWGTSLGQIKPDLKLTCPGYDNIVIGMVYKSIPVDKVYIPLGKGGHVYNSLEDEGIQLAAMFDKVYINEVRVNAPFIMLIYKEDSDSWRGRKTLKYSPKIEYHRGNNDIVYNSDFVIAAREALQLADNACWFVYNLEVCHQDELHMSAVIVDEKESVEYENSSKRSDIWKSLIPNTNYSQHNEINLSSGKDEKLQIIYYGAPGTGKSYEINRQTKGHSVIRTTFHPDSDYSTFVGAYKPIMEGEKIVYKFVKQAFLKVYLSAWKKYAEGSLLLSPQFLVIEEINRGNCAQIFGDIFQLLDRGDNMFSCYPIDVDTDIQKAIAEAFDEEGEYNLPDGFNVDGVIDNYESNYGLTLTEDIRQGHVMLLPPNLYIWATMNTSDQSLFPMDSAFKRRWNWEFVPIDYDDASQFIVEFSGGNVTMKWSDIIEVINYNIMTLMHNADKQIGNRFISLPEGQTTISSDVFFNKVMFYLWSEIYKDYYEDEDSIFRYKGDNISFEDIASAGNRDEIIVEILKSLKGKDDKAIVVTRSTTSTE